VDDFCDRVNWGSCPTFRNGGVYVECPSDANYATYSECEDGTTRFEFMVGWENDIAVVFDQNHQVILGTASYWDGTSCRVGRTPLPSTCVSCDYCWEYTGGGEGGQSGDSGDPPRARPCVMNDDGSIAMPP
jgi:hypothetical protein